MKVSLDELCQIAYLEIQKSNKIKKSKISHDFNILINKKGLILHYTKFYQTIPNMLKYNYQQRFLPPNYQHYIKYRYVSKRALSITELQSNNEFRKSHAS